MLADNRFRPGSRRGPIAGGGYQAGCAHSTTTVHGSYAGAAELLIDHAGRDGEVHERTRAALHDVSGGRVRARAQTDTPRASPPSAAIPSDRRPWEEPADTSGCGVSWVERPRCSARA